MTGRREVNIDLPNGKQLPGEGSAMVADWVDFVCTMVVIYASKVEAMEQAVRDLAERAQEQYPQLESGGRVQLRLDQTTLIEDGINFQFADKFIGITGGVLLICQDGPKVGGDLLAEQIGWLKEHVWTPPEKGGEDADESTT